MIVPLLIGILVVLVIIAALVAVFAMSMTTWQYKISEQLQQIHDLMANWK